jgi:hypothetical protein
MPVITTAMYGMIPGTTPISMITIPVGIMVTIITTTMVIFLDPDGVG